MTGSKRWVTLGGTLAAIAAIIVVIQLTLKPEPPQTSVVASQPAGGGGGSDAPEAADFTGITRWINSEPLSIAKLQGKVVLVDFWTYTCSNCINTLPYLRDWNDKYQHPPIPEGLERQVLRRGPHHSRRPLSRVRVRERRVKS